MHNPSCVSVPALLGIELPSTVPAVVRMEKGVEWLGPCREKGEGGWVVGALSWEERRGLSGWGCRENGEGGCVVGALSWEWRRGLSGWGSIVRMEKGVEWLGPCREKGEGGWAVGADDRPSWLWNYSDGASVRNSIAPPFLLTPLSVSVSLETSLYLEKMFWQFDEQAYIFTRLHALPSPNEWPSLWTPSSSSYAR